MNYHNFQALIKWAVVIDYRLPYKNGDDKDGTLKQEQFRPYNSVISVWLNLIGGMVESLKTINSKFAILCHFCMNN